MSSTEDITRRVGPKKLDLATIGDTKIIVCIGMRCSGKTSLVLDYLSHYSDIPVGMVISPTEEFDWSYRNRIPAMFIYQEMTPDLIRKFLQRQERLMAESKTDPTVDPRAFLVLDNCLADWDFYSLWNDPNTQRLFLESYELKVTLVITMMDPVGIPPRLRKCIDYVFLCKDSNRQNRRKMYEMYGKMFESLESFTETMVHTCDRFKQLVLDQSWNRGLTGPSDNKDPSDYVYAYRADMKRVRSVKMCCQKFWDSEENQVKTHDLSNRPFCLNLDKKIS